MNAMAENYKAQSPAYHGIRNAKYCVRGEDGAAGSTVADLSFAKSISFEPAVETLDVYANDQKVLALISDKGYSGEFGTTAQDRAFETSLGQAIEVESGTADINIIGYKRFDMYYEYTEYTSSNNLPYTVKVWVLNAEASKATKEYNTNEDTPTIGEYLYPITVYGDKILDKEGTNTYKDANGNELVATRVIAVPSDTGYATFGDSVPKVKMKSVGA
jgi:hypothetical protein